MASSTCLLLSFFFVFFHFLISFKDTLGGGRVAGEKPEREAQGPADTVQGCREGWFDTEQKTRIPDHVCNKSHIPLPCQCDGSEVSVAVNKAIV